MKNNITLSFGKFTYYDIKSRRGKEQGFVSGRSFTSFLQNNIGFPAFLWRKNERKNR